MNSIKYPRTRHLPWSLGATKDDLILQSTNCFLEKRVVVTEKLDGENTTLYRNTLHARSVEPLISHPARSWIKSLHSSICYLIPEGWRICGENVYAQHSIRYEKLESFFYIFSIWNEKNICLSWDDTLEWSKILNIPTPRVFYIGQWNTYRIKKIAINNNNCEGYVVRISDPFHFSFFKYSVAKYVRKEHVSSNQKHWLGKKVIRNQLIK